MPNCKDHITPATSTPVIIKHRSGVCPSVCLSVPLSGPDRPIHIDSSAESTKRDQRTFRPLSPTADTVVFNFLGVAQSLPVSYHSAAIQFD